ncbi:MAG: serine/threonine protein kinase, partial [Candidatus Dormibacteraceae bacterium]
MTQNVNEDKALRDSIEELSGSTCGEFRLLDCLGYGTHTAVYSSIDGGGGTWAVKLIDSAIDSDEALLARIQHDADRLAIMDDPTILPIGHSGQSGRYTYGGTRLVDGRPLSELMLAGSVGSDAAWHLLCELAEALERSFERGLICRVIKPSNILVDGDGRPHLTEFGLAGQLVGPMALSSPGYRLGFPQYLAPEQVNGQLGDERTDVYAVATLVFELLTETPLFDGSNPGEVLRAVKLTPPPSAHSRNAALPPAVDRVLSQALAKDPLSRPRSVSELLDQLMNLPEPASTGTNSAAMSIDTAAAVLNRMGVPQINFNGTPVLNSYLSFLLRQARLVAAEHWSDVLTAAGLQHYCEQLPPDDGERVVGAETVGALADGFSRVFGADSQEYLRQLGIKSTQEWMEATQ